MNNEIAESDENLRRVIIQRVLLGIFIIGIIQSITTIYGHQSNPKTLMLILSLVPLTGISYFYVRKIGKAKVIGRVLMYCALPILLYRAYPMGGVWGVTTNWIYLVPVFGALFLGKKEIIFLSVVATVLMIWLAIAHNQNPDYSMTQLQLVPAFARIAYILLPMYVISYVIIFYENQRKRYIHEIQEQANKELENEKLISIGSMTAGIAHEINNPLMVLKGAINLLSVKMQKTEIKEKEKFDKYIESLNIGVERITGIVNSIRELSTDKTNLTKNPIIVKDLFHQILDSVKQDLVENEIKFTTNVDIPTLTIIGAQIQIEQILINFISNSIYEIKSKKDPWITLTATKMNDLCLIRIIDSGTGIDKSHINQLFNPFFTIKKVGDGTGLGLSLCKKLASNNNGDIYYESYNGHTSFVLLIPLV